MKKYDDIITKEKFKKKNDYLYKKDKHKMDKKNMCKTKEKELLEIETLYNKVNKFDKMDIK